VDLSNTFLCAWHMAQNVAALERYHSKLDAAAMAVRREGARVGTPGLG
jgi:hypothetical protein